MATPVQYQAGSLSPTSGSEEFLIEAVLPGIYEVLIRLNNMVSGDIVTIRQYRSPESGVDAHPSYLEKDWVLNDAQTYNLFSTGPVGNGFHDLVSIGFAVSLQQSAGTHRHFDYTILAY